MTDEKYDKQIKRIRKETDKISKNIQNFNIEESSPSKLDQWFKELDKLKEEVGDLIDEIEVEDFLENGPGIKNKNI